MKVYWLVSNYPHHANPQAGIFYKFLAESIVKAHVELTIIAPIPRTFGIMKLVGSKYKTYALAPAKECPTEGLTILRPRYLSIPGESNFKCVSFFMQSAILRLKLTKPDVMHGFGAYPVSLVATQLARKYNCKSITTFIGSDVNEFPVRNKKSMKLFLETIENSHHVLTVSKALAKRVFDLGGKMAEVVHMPIRGLKELDFSRDVFRKDLGIGTNQFVVLFAGSISLSKGVKELCEALNMLSDEPNIMALFAGPEGDAISILKQQKNARWMGNLSHDELMNVMHASDVLVLPSKMEGIPGVIKEAGQCMLPVVASNVGGIPEVVNNSNGYLIEKVDAQNIYNAILHVYKNIDWAKERAARMKSYIMEEFDGDKIAQRQLYIYSKDIQTNN